MREFDIRVKYGELPFIPEGRMTKVGDHEHLRIIKVRATAKGRRKGEPISEGDMVKQIGRSSATIHKHIYHHNNQVHLIGECDKCARIGSPFAKETIE